MFPKGLGVFMANRWLNQFLLSQRKGHVTEAGTITLSSAAAVSSSDFTSLVRSVTKTATGEYTITLADKWVSLLNVQVSFEGTELKVLKVKSADPVSAKTIVVQTVDIGGVVVQDVSSASKLHVTISLKNSTAR
jgi:hypothetical protein